MNQPACSLFVFNPKLYLQKLCNSNKSGNFSSVVTLLLESTPLHFYTTPYSRRQLRRGPSCIIVMGSVTCDSLSGRQIPGTCHRHVIPLHKPRKSGVTEIPSRVGHVRMSSVSLKTSTTSIPCLKAFPQRLLFPPVEA